jgi:hypothetical protein
MAQIVFFTTIRRMLCPVDADEYEQGWCKEGEAIPFLSNVI